MDEYTACLTEAAGVRRTVAQGISADLNTGVLVPGTAPSELLVADCARD